MDFLRYIISSDVYPVLDAILMHLTASDVGSLLDATGTRRGFRYSVRYLNPLRDIEPDMRYLGEMLKDHTILMLGEHTVALNQRIMDSKRYWRSDNSYSDLVGALWVVAIPKDRDACISEATKYMQLCTTMGEAESWESHAYNFTNVAISKIFKQVYAQDDQIGYVGDRPDWYLTWHSTSHRAVDCSKTHLIYVVPRVPSELYSYSSADVLFHGLGFHIGTDHMYPREQESKPWDKLPYINVSMDPLSIRRSVGICNSSVSDSTRMTLCKPGKDNTYISLC